MKQILVLLVSVLLTSTWVPVSLCAKKPVSVARKEDIPYLKCQVCEKLASQLYHQVQTKQAQISPKKVFLSSGFGGPQFEQVFNFITPQPEVICIQARRYLDSYRDANKSPTCPRITEQVCWQPPPENVFKLNCDGALKENGRAGIGVVVRDADREVLGALAYPVSSCLTVKEIEAMAIREGLIFAKNCCFQRLIVESDACEIIEEVLRDTPSLSLHGNIIEDIKSLSLQFALCSFKFVRLFKSSS